MSERYSIIWKEKVVGYISDLVNDMWYFDGKFIPADLQLAAEFISLVSGLELANTFKDPSKGIRVVLTSQNESSKKMDFVVLAIEGMNLSMRMLSVQ